MSAPFSTAPSALNSRQIARSLLDGKDLTDASFYPEHFDWYWQAAYGLSTAFSSAAGEEKLFTRAPLDCFDTSSAPIPSEAIFNIASISKPFTAATILRMIEDERYSAYFPAALETKLSHFYEMLESRYPESDYVRSRLRDENPEISLKDLILHVSGIGDFDIEKYGQSFRFETPENLAKPGDGKHLEPERRDGEYGEYKYSDIGYELLGMVISAIATRASGGVITCGTAMRDLVIDRLGLEHTFTPDEMGFDADGRVAVVGRPEKIIARGYDCQYSGNNLIESKVFRRCISASALYSNPSDICTFAKRTFSKKTYVEGGLFDKPETIEMQNKFSVVCSYEDARDESGKVVCRTPKVTPDLGIDKYGIGFSFFENDEKKKTLMYHGARTAGYSGWFGYQDGKAACCLVSCQNLTTYFARAKLEQELGRAVKIDSETAEIHTRFAAINAELFAKHSKEELLAALRKAEFHPNPGVKSKENNHRDLLRELEALEKSKADQTTGSVAAVSADAVAAGAAARRGDKTP